MTDTLTPAAAAPAGPVPSAAPPLASPPPDAAGAIDSTLTAAPELKNDPASAVAVANTGGSPVVAQAVTQAGKRQANADAQNRVQASGGGGLFGDVIHLGSDALGAVAHAANVGLKTVQQEYRYLHDVEARHGLGAALLEGAGILGGAVAGGALGTLAGGNTLEGAALGAEGATWIEGHVTYKNSWAAAANPNYRDPHTHQLVSFGRDVTSALGIGGAAKTVTSGVLDGLGDLIADPVGLAGKAVAGERMLSITADNVDRAFKNPLSGFRNAAEDMAGSDAATIARRYPQFQSIAEELGAQHSAEDVKNVFRDFAGASEMLDATKYPSSIAETDDAGRTVVTTRNQPLEINSATLPSLLATRKVTRAIGEAAGNSGGGDSWFANHIANNVLVGPARWARRLARLPGTTFDRASMDIGGTQINPANTNGLNDFMSTMRYALTERETRAIGQTYAMAAGPAERIVVVRNGIMKMLSTMSGIPIPDDVTDYEKYLGDYLTELNRGDVKQKIWERLNNHLAVANIEGTTPDHIFGAIDGKNVRPVYNEDGELQGGITRNQTGNISLPDLIQARRMAQAVRSARVSRMTAGLDDFAYDHITQGFFKPLVLMSGGYGLHISLAEMIPNALRHGLANTAKTLYDRTIANMGYKADQGELDGLSGWLWDMGGERAFKNSEEAQRLTAAYILMEGHKATPGLGAGEALNGEINQTERASQAFRAGIPVGFKTGDRFGLFGSEDGRFPKLWQAELREGANDEWTQTAARAYRDALANGRSIESLPDDVEPSLERDFTKDGGSTLSHKTRGPLYRESSVQDAADTLYGSRGLGGQPLKYWHNDRGLALGQGESKGVVIERDADSLHGHPSMTKPGAEFQAQEGRAEFQAFPTKRGLDGVRSVEMRSSTARDYNENDVGGMSAERRGEVTEASTRAGLRLELQRSGYKKFDLPSGERWVRSTLVKRDAHPLSEVEATESARQAVVRHLQTEPQNVLDNYVREQLPLKGAPGTWTPMDGHAQAIVEKLKGAVHGRSDVDGNTGKLHMDFLNSVANGHTPNLEDIKAIGQEDRPAFIKGREVVPDATSTVQRIANFGFRKILNPMVNMLSRHQEFASEYLSAREALQDKVDAGIMSEDQATTTAMAQATTHAMRFVHNLHDRTQWTATMRNWAPFYFAQEQAYRRMGRLLAEDPGAFRRYQLMISGVHSLAVNKQDSNGNRYIAFPGSGLLGKGVADLMGESGLSVGNVTPAGFGGSFSSANVIFPLSQGFKPDLGPVVVVPTMALSSMFTELGKTYGAYRPAANLAANDLSDVVGSQAMSAGIMSQIIPNAFVARLVEAFQGDDRAFNSSVMQAYQLADYQQEKATEEWQRNGEHGPAPQIVPPQDATAAVRQKFQDKIRNMVRALYIANAITGMFSPVSSNVEMQNFGFPAKLDAEITKEGSVSMGMQKFLIDNPDALPYTVAQSYTPSQFNSQDASGQSLLSSDAAQAWITSNSAGMEKYGAAFMWLMPQQTDATYDPTVYNEQIAQGLRVKDTPDQFLNALYIAAGNNVFYKGLAVHEQRLSALGSSSSAKNAEYDAWDQWVQGLEKQYPVWAEDYLSPTKQIDRQQTIQTLQSVYQAGDEPDTKQSSLVAQLLVNYQQAAAEFQAAANQTSYSQQLSDQSAVKNAWINYTDGLETSVPALKPIIQSVFKDALEVNTSSG